MMPMEIYNELRSVPAGACSNGAINPMWRIKALTENFGPCGIGWWYEITDKGVYESGGEAVAMVDIKLYYEFGGKVSKGIPGTGCCRLFSKAAAGGAMRDEAFKRALSDAVSVAAVALGLGADAYLKEEENSNLIGSSSASASKESEKSALNPLPTGEEWKSSFFVGKCTCARCKNEILPYTGKSGNIVTVQHHAEFCVGKYGEILCLSCIKKQRDKEELQRRDRISNELEPRTAV